MPTFLAGDWEQNYGVQFIREELAGLDATLFGPTLSAILSSPCPFTEGKTVGGTHFVFLGLSVLDNLPLTLSRLMKLHSDPLGPKVFEGGKFQFQELDFASTTTGEDGLYLVPTCYPFSGMSFEEQLRRLPSTYTVSLVVEAVQAQFLHYRKTGDYFGGSMFGRCRERLPGDCLMQVGAGDPADGIMLVKSGQDGPCDGVGLALHRKVNIGNIVQ